MKRLCGEKIQLIKCKFNREKNTLSILSIIAISRESSYFKILITHLLALARWKKEELHRSSIAPKCKLNIIINFNLQKLLAKYRLAYEIFIVFFYLSRGIKHFITHIYRNNIKAEGRNAREEIFNYQIRKQTPSSCISICLLYSYL